MIIGETTQSEADEHKKGINPAEPGVTARVRNCYIAFKPKKSSE
jgi:predicted transport protein